VKVEGELRENPESESCILSSSLGRTEGLGGTEGELLGEGTMLRLSAHMLRQVHHNFAEAKASYLR
jgi:hypothetical protein